MHQESSYHLIVVPGKETLDAIFVIGHLNIKWFWTSTWQPNIWLIWKNSLMTSEETSYKSISKMNRKCCIRIITAYDFNPNLLKSIKACFQLVDRDWRHRQVRAVLKAILYFLINSLNAIFRTNSLEHVLFPALRIVFSFLEPAGNLILYLLL